MEKRTSGVYDRMLMVMVSVHDGIHFLLSFPVLSLSHTHAPKKNEEKPKPNLDGCNINLYDKDNSLFLSVSLCLSLCLSVSLSLLPCLLVYPPRKTISSVDLAGTSHRNKRPHFEVGVLATHNEGIAQAHTPRAATDGERIARANEDARKWLHTFQSRTYQ